MDITLTLTPEQVAGLRYWHTTSADFGDVEHETGADLVALLDAIAKRVSEED